jgi:hypothetical protein
MAFPSHDRTVTLSTDRTSKGLLHSDTCRIIYFGNSAKNETARAVVGALI